MEATIIINTVFKLITAPRMFFTKKSWVLLKKNNDFSSNCDDG